VLPPVIRPYRNGRDLAQKSQGRYVIDFFGLSEDEARTRHPRLFQWVLDRVRPERDARVNNSKDSAGYARLWWLFARPRPDMRRALAGLPRYIATISLEKGKRNWSAYCPDLPVIATGRTREATVRRTAEAIRLHLDGLAEDGRRRPTPRSDTKVLVFA
jgi:predicted RNase H-like HicB family nuclease